MFVLWPFAAVHSTGRSGNKALKTTTNNAEQSSVDNLQRFPPSQLRKGELREGFLLAGVCFLCFPSTVLTQRSFTVSIFGPHSSSSV